MSSQTSSYLVRRLAPATARHVAERVLHNVVRAVVRVVYRFDASGLQHVPEGPAVLVCNHVSFADAPIVAAAFRRPVRFVMDHRIYGNPLLNWFFRTVGVIPIAQRRTNPEMLEEAFEKIAAALRRGELVCIFPEGMITHDGELNTFRAGIERIVTRTPVPVVPMAVRGMWGSFFSRRYGRAMAHVPRRLWSKVALRLGPPVSPSQASAARLADEVADLLRQPA